MDYYAKAERYSPILCRLLARERYGRPLSTGELAEKSGLTKYEVEAISQEASWGGVKLDIVRRFTIACGTDFASRADMRRISDYMRKKPTFAYLKKSGNFREYYLPLIIKWRDQYAGEHRQPQ
jgi:hypothetical protein